MYDIILNSFLLATAAGDAFRSAANLHMQLGTRHEAATNLVEAGQVMKRDDPKGMCADCSIT